MRRFRPDRIAMVVLLIAALAVILGIALKGNGNTSGGGPDKLPPVSINPPTPIEGGAGPVVPVGEKDPVVDPVLPVKPDKTPKESSFLDIKEIKTLNVSCRDKDGLFLSDFYDVVDRSTEPATKVKEFKHGFPDNGKIVDYEKGHCRYIPPSLPCTAHVPITFSDSTGMQKTVDLEIDVNNHPVRHDVPGNPQIEITLPVDGAESLGWQCAVEANVSNIPDGELVTFWVLDSSGNTEWQQQTIPVVGGKLGTHVRLGEKNGLGVNETFRIYAKSKADVMSNIVKATRRH